MIDASSLATKAAAIVWTMPLVDGGSEMEFQLTLEDCRLILESLEYTKKAFRETGVDPSGPYPSAEFKIERMAELDQVIERVRQLRDQLKMQAE